MKRLVVIKCRTIVDADAFRKGGICLKLLLTLKRAGHVTTPEIARTKGAPCMLTLAKILDSNSCNNNTK